MLLFMLAGCSSTDAQTTEYAGTPHSFPTQSNYVQVLRNEPQRLHARLGEVIIDASINPAPPISDIELKLREQAATPQWWSMIRFNPLSPMLVDCYGSKNPGSRRAQTQGSRHQIPITSLK